MSEQFILLPQRGLRGEVPVPSVTRLRVPRARKLRLDESAGVDRFETSGGEALQRLSVGRVKAKVIDEIDDGPKLVELPAGSLAKARASTPGIRYVRQFEYEPATVRGDVSGAAPAAQTAPPAEFEVRCADSGKPLPGARVTAIVDRRQRLGASGVSDADGRVSLRLGPVPQTLETLQVEPPRHGWWGSWREKVRLSGTNRVALTPIDLAAEPLDALRHFYGTTAPGSDGAGVRIGVVDTGIGDHRELTVSGGHNTVKGEDKDDYGSNGVDHGTHVAGIIAASGKAHKSMRGLAPEAELLSYRVYGEGERKTTSFSIVKAILRAIDAECDLINLSLECPEDDNSIAEAVDEAHLKGIVVIGASGNDGGSQGTVSPARYGTAVTALGRLHTFPTDSLESGHVGGLKGEDPDDFLADFCTTGPDVDLTAPGLGVISTVLGGYAPESGTSMAAAAATGMAARLLSAQPEMLAMLRDRRRYEAMQNLINANAADVGFGFAGQGYGMLGR